MRKSWLSKDAAELSSLGGQKGGKAKTKAKVAAARQNGE
jgi:hypothetical protein